MSAEKSTSKTDTLVKVVLVFFISLLSFSVGTFVGKQVSDSDHRRLALEGEFKGADRQVASADSKSEGEAAGPDKISDKEVESLTEEFVNKEKSAGGEEVAARDEGEASEKSGDKPVEKVEAAEKSAEKVAESGGEKSEAGGYKKYSRAKVVEAKIESKAAPKAEDVKPSEGKEKSESVAEKIAEGKAPSDGAKEARKPASSLPSVAASAVGKYTVQVSAYADEKEAKTRVGELKGKGWNAFYFAAEIKGRTWYRVSVGLFNNMASADEFKAQFMKDSGTKSAYVQKIIQ